MTRGLTLAPGTVWLTVFSGEGRDLGEVQCS